MHVVTPCDLPAESLLNRQRDAGAFADCHAIDVRARITAAQFVEAFYTTRLFKLERWLIRWLSFKPSSDLEARELGTGLRDDFAVWRVEQRLRDQVLLADPSGRTRSWLMVAPLEAAASAPATRLYFGSALLPRVDRRSGEKRFGLLFRLLLGLHGSYSRALLRAAAAKLSGQADLA